MSLVCAIYTRKSSEEGLEKSFNSLDAQREASEAFILSQKAQGWKPSKASYDDGGYSGGNLQRPALQRLLADVASGRVQIVVVYKVDRLTRSLADFAKLVELFDAHGVSFVSVTQQFNTTSSMGRLTLNVLLSFAQFEREVTGERIRDKIAASKRKGLWMGGIAPIGYRPHERTLVIDEPRAERVREMYGLYLELGCVSLLKRQVDAQGWRTPVRLEKGDVPAGDRPFSRGHLHRILSSPIYAGRIVHKEQVFDGNHPAIIEQATWQAVQQRLKQNRQGRRTRGNAKDTSLLAGLVFDEKGNRLTPSHAKKGQRRYRYYVNLASDEQALRVPALELETAVVNALAGLLSDDGRLLTLLGVEEADRMHAVLRQAKSTASSLSQVGAVRIEAALALVERVTIEPGSLRLTIRNEAISGAPGLTQIEVPVELKRSGVAMRLVVKDGVRTSEPRVDARLVTLISKAQGWFADLASGRCSSVAEVAAQSEVGSSYVARVMHLAFLAPDIVERIVRGEAPADLTVDRLCRIGALPMEWQEQRRLLGMAT